MTDENAHEKALKAAIENVWNGIGDEVLDFADAKRRIARAVVGAYLAALPPSIVVDGKVVGLEQAIHQFMPRHRLDFCSGLLDAAREVAGE